MSMENVSDKVNIHVGEGGGHHDGGAGLAAVIAALGNRNQGGDNAGLIAALGNRNHSELGPLMAMMCSRDRNDGDGMGSMWPLLLLLLAGRGRGGGLFGGDDGGSDCAGHNVLQTLVENQGDIRAAIPTLALETQNAILSAIGRSELATQQGFANTKDAVQNSLFAVSQTLANINQNVSSQGCQTRETVKEDGEKTRSLITSNTIMDLQRQLGVAQADAKEERHLSRVREVEVNVSQNVNQQQAQAQFQTQLQAQFGQLFGALNTAVANINNNRSNQDILNLGTMLASGTQTPTTTQVNR